MSENLKSPDERKITFIQDRKKTVKDIADMMLRDEIEDYTYRPLWGGSGRENNASVYALDYLNRSARRIPETPTPEESGLVEKLEVSVAKIIQRAQKLDEEGLVEKYNLDRKINHERDIQISIPEDGTGVHVLESIDDGRSKMTLIGNLNFVDRPDHRKAIIVEERRAGGLRDSVKIVDFRAQSDAHPEGIRASYQHEDSPSVQTGNGYGTDYFLEVGSIEIADTIASEAINRVSLLLDQVGN